MKYQQLLHMHACFISPPLLSVALGSLFSSLLCMTDREIMARWKNHIKTSTDIKAVFKATKGKIQEADGVNIGRLP